MDENNLLVHALLNQLESDFEEQEYDSIDELLSSLIKDDKNKVLLIEYLSDTAKENWLEGKTNTDRF